MDYPIEYPKHDAPPLSVVKEGEIWLLSGTVGVLRPNVFFSCTEWQSAVEHESRNWKVTWKETSIKAALKHGFYYWVGEQKHYIHPA